MDIILNYIWECMTIAYKGFLGFILWMFVTTIIAILIVQAFSKERRDTLRKPKYKGEPIVIKGGKKDET